MCGITGMVGRNPLTDAEHNRVCSMSQHLAHRGPDGEGDFKAPHVALAMRRLSIIDLDGGWQPLFNEDRSLVIVANGEIYNYIELQKDLRQRGHQLRTGSDIETILHLYEDYGPDCVQYLRGMFAFALWDQPRQRLLLARDRMGEKPLYVWEHAGRLQFASELKALVSGLDHKPELDPAAIDLFFHYSYIPEPKTPLVGVRKLPAGHVLSIDIESWKISETEYWNISDAPALDGDPVEAIRAELDTISGLVIRSDVPVGIALSGGLDSGAIAALTSRKYPGTMHAFSVGYPGRPAYDERADAKELADHLGIPFHAVELETSDLVQLFPQLVYSADDPIADIAGYGYYAVSKLAREHGVPVLLQGQGGDELFWGYRSVQQAAEDTLLKQSLNNGELSGLRKQAAEFSYKMAPLPQTLSPSAWKSWLRRAGRSPEGISRWQRLSSGPQETVIFQDNGPDFQIAQNRMNQLYHPAFAADLPERNPYQLFTFKPPWHDVPVMLTRLIAETYLLENGIAQGDRLSMASSVELRLPLVDYKLVETVVGFRKKYPDHRLGPKEWLKRALKGVLPDHVMNRPKRGFQPPIREWSKALLKEHGSVLHDGHLVQSGVLTKTGAASLAHGEGLDQGVMSLPFKALCLELWCRQVRNAS